MDTNVETFSFHAETTRLLQLMIHSLYTSKEIFLRELLSNASDALDRLRLATLTNSGTMGDDTTLEIRLDPDRNARTLTICDTGVGMSRAELINHLGTIAKSGTREMLEELQRQGKSSEVVDKLIGRFGVGFYSAFMVADKVTVITRSATEQTATRWESTGNGQYTLAEAEKPQRGTSITLHLKPVDVENGIEDYTDEWVLRRIVKKHSDFLTYPIRYRAERKEVERDAQGQPKPNGPQTTIIEDVTLNSMKPLWTRPQSEVTEEQYTEFYHHLGHDWQAPFKTLSFKAEGRFEFQALLFIPAQAPYDLYFHAAPFGLQLYAQRVMIMEQCEDLLPRYLRFLKGVVDSADLPLNISRQRLQQDRHITQIRQWVTRKILDTLTSLLEEEPETYMKFWEQFGRTLKEGVSFDRDNKERLVPLLFFPSSHDQQKLTTLKAYIERMPAEQIDIFYATGESRQVVENSPHLEAIKAKGYEVLFFIEPVDELAAQALSEFDGKKLKSVGKGTVNLGSQAEQEQNQQALKEQSETYGGLLQAFQKHLDAYVKEVRLSNRLTASPVCLVVAEHEYSPQMDRLLRPGAPTQRRIMELNPAHPIVMKLQEDFQRNPVDSTLETYADLLFGYGLLAEGSALSDPVRFNQRVMELMLRNL